MTERRDTTRQRSAPTLDGPEREVVAARLRRLFWDHPLRSSDLIRYPRWVLERVLEYGDLEDVRGLIRVMGRERFLDHVSQARFRCKRTANFWRQILQREGRACTRTYSRPTVWP